MANRASARVSPALAVAAAWLCVPERAGAQQNCDLETGLTNVQWNNHPRVWNNLLKVCQSNGFLKGQFCFKWGSAFQCIPSTIGVGQEMSMSAGFEAGGFNASAGVTYSASQEFSCDATQNRRCQFFVCHDNATLQPWQCECFLGIWSWNCSTDVFGSFGGTTVICCCQNINCSLSSGFDAPPGGGASLGNTVGSVFFDLSSYFDVTAGAPPPGHPILGPHSFFAELSSWHLCEIQMAARDAEMMEGFPINEIVIMDVDGTTHHFDWDDDAPPFTSTLLSQHLSPAIVPGNSVACTPDGGITTADNQFARSFDLSAVLPGEAMVVSCVEWAMESNNAGVLTTAAVNIYEDADGGAPGAPGADLVLLGSQELLIPGDAGGQILTAALEAPVLVPADTVMVVELAIPDTSGITGIWPASNPDGQTGPSYVRSAICGLPAFADLADLGFPDMHMVMRVLGNPAGAPCAWDIGGDGVVGITDLLAILGAWGPNPGHPADFNGDGIVGITDLIKLLSNWGPCP